MRNVFCLLFTLLAAPALLTPTLAQSPAHTITIPASQQGTVLCTAGDTLILSGPFTVPNFKTCALTADRRPVDGQSKENDPTNPAYAFQWRADAPGGVNLAFVYILDNKAVVTGRRLTVIASAAAPAVLVPLPKTFDKAAAGEDLPATVTMADDFHAARADFFMDGRLVDSATAAPYTVSMPFAGAAAGPHQVSVQVVNASGDRYFSPVQTVIVPGAVSSTGLSNSGLSAVGRPSLDALGAAVGITGRPYAYSYAFGEKTVVQEGDFGQHSKLLGYTLHNPSGLALDPQGRVYVSDNFGIALFTSDGTFVQSYSYYGAAVVGTLDISTGGLAADTYGNIYVADKSSTINKYGPNPARFGSHGAAHEQFDGPAGLALDGQGSVYIADYYNNRVQKETTDGTFIRAFGSYGEGPGQLKGPSAVALSGAGDVYVADPGNNRVDKFDSRGNFVLSFGTAGNERGQMNAPLGVAVDGAGDVYVADTANNRIQKFNSSGQFITSFGDSGSPQNMLHGPASVAVDHSGSVFVVDSRNNRIVVFHQVP